MFTQRVSWRSPHIPIVRMCTAAAPLAQVTLCICSVLLVLHCVTAAPPQPLPAQHEQPTSVFIFAKVMDDSFNASELPLTADLMADVADDAVAAAAKRDRPHPDATAVRVTAWAELLSNIYADRRETLIAYSRELAHESHAGPDEIASGQKLGTELARQLLADRLFRWRLEAAKDECQD